MFVEKTIADDGSSFDRAIAIDAKATNRVDITDGGQKVYFKFTPEDDRIYTIASSGILDTYVELYRKTDISQVVVSNDDYNEVDKNFYFRFNLSRNTTYYFVVRLSNPKETGSFEFAVK